MSAQYGIPLAYIPNYEGVAKERKLHNVGFLVAFLAVFLGFFIVVIYAASAVDLEKQDQMKDNWSRDQAVLVKKDLGAIVGLSFYSVALGFLWLWLLKAHPKTMIWVSLIGTLAIFALFTIFLFIVNVVAGIIMGLCLLFFGFIIMRMKSRVQFSAVVLSEGSKGLGDNVGLMIGVTPALIAMSLVFFTMFSVGIVHAAAMKPNPDPCTRYLRSDCMSDSKCAFDYDSYTCYAPLESRAVGIIFYEVFAYFWTINFGNMVFQCIVAGAIARWYFTKTGSLMTSIKNTLYASGSLACGSFIIAVIQFFKFLMRVAESRSRNIGVILLACCLRLICSLLEGIIKYINRYAVIYIAMNGTSFMESCRAVFNLFERQLWNVLLNDVIINYVANFGVLMGICLSNVPSVLLFLVSKKDETMHIMSFVVVLVASLAVFLIASACVRVACDTIMVCFCEDMERNSMGQTFAASRDFIQHICSHKDCPDTYKQYGGAWAPPPMQPNYGAPVAGTPVPAQPQQYGYQPQYPVQPQYGQPQYGQPVAYQPYQHQPQIVPKGYGT